jgi:O-acetyl-ADP-ribose deacetylase (regulator of RNase III)
MSLQLPEIWLTARESDVLDTWKNRFGDVSGVRVVPCTDVSEVIPHCRTIISPAQSFGVMDGGIDAAYSAYFGWGLQEQLRTKIANEFYGELHVGQYCIVPIDEVHTLVSVPTMRVPQFVRETTNAYIAFRAALIACIEHQLEGPVLCPGLCVGVGRMNPLLCAHQMRMAWDSITDPRTIKTLGQATRHEMCLLDPEMT